MRKGSRPRKAKSIYLKDGSLSEAVIQKQILSWLKECGACHWRQNSGVVFAGNRSIKLGEEGLPDIVVVVPPGGRLLGLEVKSAKGQLRPGQKAFKVLLESVGGYYKVVRSLHQAMDAVAEVMGTERFREWTLLRAGN